MSFPRLCIIGAGILSTRRIYPYIAAAGAKLVGVCDMDIAKAQRNAELFGGEAFADADEMLDTLKPNGVIVCIGPNAHPELALNAIKRGIPVYTEKPPAADAETALSVAIAAKQANVLCMTAFKKRYTAAADRAKAWAEGKDLYSISIDYASGKYSNADARNSFLLDFGVHIIDLTQYLFGDVDSVMCFSKGLDAYAVTLKFKNGAVGVLNLNDGRSFSYPTEEIELTAANGCSMTIHNSASWKIAENEKCTEWREPCTFISAGDSGNDTGHLAELVYFVNAITNGAKTAPSQIYESYKTMVLYEAIAKSAATGEIVKLQFDII